MRFDATVKVSVDRRPVVVAHMPKTVFLLGITMFMRLDSWIGLRIMHPPIIWFCQLTGINQYSLYRYLWVLIAFEWVATDDHSSICATAFFAVFAVGRTASAAIDPGRYVQPGYIVLRMYILFMLAVQAIGIAMTHSIGIAAQVLITALVAEYATTIITIPPRKKHEAKQTTREQMV